MSQYDPLWQWIHHQDSDCLKLTFPEIESILGFPINHSFLTHKKELLPFGFRVLKISLKEKTVLFERLKT